MTAEPRREPVGHMLATLRRLSTVANRLIAADAPAEVLHEATRRASVTADDLDTLLDKTAAATK